jgi:hypothetical protein
MSNRRTNKRRWTIRYSRRISSVLEELSMELVRFSRLVGKRSPVLTRVEGGPILALHFEGWLA